MKAPSNWGPEYAKAFDAIYPDLAAKYGVPLYPFFLEGVALDPAFTQPDGLHPTAAGVAEIVKRIMPDAEAFVATHRANASAEIMHASLRLAPASEDYRCPDCSPPSSCPTKFATSFIACACRCPARVGCSPRAITSRCRFAGDIDNEKRASSRPICVGIEPDGFEIRLSGLGVFGGDDPHAILAGVEPDPELEELARAHEKAARNAGLAPERGLQATRHAGAPEALERRRRRADF